jgi:uncharacterized short protein YbdD (DUF466 family)
MKISQAKEMLKSLISKLNGNSEYRKYLEHFNQNHHQQKPLNKKQFFTKKEQEKWSKINRCC